MSEAVEPAHCKLGAGCSNDDLCFCDCGICVPTKEALEEELEDDDADDLLGEEDL